MSLTTRLNIDAIEDGSIPLAKLEEEVAVKNDIPAALKNPHALTVQGNGITIDSYDGSSAKTINITPASIGADTKPFSTERDFENGTLIKTNIDYSVTNGVPFYVEIKGNTYDNIGSMFIQAQGYIYNDTIVNYSVTSLGKIYPEQFIAINVDGNLCFWFPRIGYWHGYSVKVTTGYDYSINCVTDVIDTVEPAGTKCVVLSNNYFINHGFDSNSGGDISINPAGNYLRPVYINGNNEAQPVEGIEDTLIKWKHPDQLDQNTNLLTLFSPIDVTASQLHSANRLAYGNPDGITVEYSTDGGATWIDYELTNAQKIQLISNQSFGAEIRAGKALSTLATANDKLRITINAITTGLYTSARALYINFGTNGSEQCILDVERANIGSESNFTVWKTGLILDGWSGWNKLPLGGIAFGGWEGQTSNIGAIRLTISSNGAGSYYTNGCHFAVYDLQLIGDTTWITCSNMGKNGHLYDYDYNQNALFPANVSAQTFIGNLNGNATSATSATSANKASALSSVTNGNTTTSAGTGEIIYSRFQQDMLGSLPGGDNANGVITINTHAGDYHHQLGFTGSGMFYRRRHGSALNNSASWSKIAMTSDIPTDYARVGDGSIYIYPQYGNEINFGGTNTKTELYFGYRGVDSKPAPTTYIFGKLDSLANIKAKFVGNLTGKADTAGSTVGTLTIAQPSGSTTFNGSTDTTININRTTLGLDKVMDYIGKTSITLSDGVTTNPITIDSKSVTAANGNVVIDAIGREYIWNGSAWELFGVDDVASSYKPKQSVVNDPTASGISTTFIDTISQDVNGKITVTKKNIPTIPTSLPWSSITSKPVFATVATTGSYNDLTNKPTIPTIPSSLPSNGIINAYTTNGITSPVISVSGAIRFDTMVCTQYLGNTNKFTGCNNAILSISRFVNNQYTTQLGFSGNGIYARIFSGETPDTSTSWRTMIMDDGAGNVTANAYYISSDERLKTFGDDIKVDFDELAKLRKSHFVFNDNPTKQEIGVSAQEVQKIYPEIVNETEEGTLSVDYSKLAVVALAAIDKLNQRVQELENKLAKYE